MPQGRDAEQVGQRQHYRWENLLYRFQGGPEGPLAPPARDGSAALPLALTRGWPLTPGRLARKAKGGAAEIRGSHGAAADLTRGPLAAAPSG